MRITSTAKTCRAGTQPFHPAQPQGGIPSARSPCASGTGIWASKTLRSTMSTPVDTWQSKTVRHSKPPRTAVGLRRWCLMTGPRQRALEARNKTLACHVWKGKSSGVRSGAPLQRGPVLAISTHIPSLLYARSAEQVVARYSLPL